MYRVDERDGRNGVKNHSIIDTPIVNRQLLLYVRSLPPRSFDLSSNPVHPRELLLFAAQSEGGLHSVAKI